MWVHQTKSARTTSVHSPGSQIWPEASDCRKENHERETPLRSKNNVKGNTLQRASSSSIATFQLTHWKLAHNKLKSASRKTYFIKQILNWPFFVKFTLMLHLIKVWESRKSTILITFRTQTKSTHNKYWTEVYMMAIAKIFLFAYGPILTDEDIIEFCTQMALTCSKQELSYSPFTKPALQITFKSSLTIWKMRHSTFSYAWTNEISILIAGKCCFVQGS